MARLEELTTGTRLTGLAASGSATVESVQWIGEQALKVIYRDGEPSQELIEIGGPGPPIFFCPFSPQQRVPGNGSFGGDCSRNAQGPNAMRQTRAF